MRAHPRLLILADLAADRLRRGHLVVRLVEPALEALAVDIGKAIRVRAVVLPDVDRQPLESLDLGAGLEPVDDGAGDLEGQAEIPKDRAGPRARRDHEAIGLVGVLGGTD